MKKPRTNRASNIEVDLFNSKVNSGAVIDLVNTESIVKDSRRLKESHLNKDLDTAKAIEKTMAAKVKTLRQFAHEKCYADMDDNFIINANILSIEVTEPCVDLIVTSPPYNVDIQYNSNNDELEYEDYLNFTHDWLRKCYDISLSGARLCLNIPLDKNKGGMQSVYADFVKIAKESGWQYFTTIVWNEGNISRRTAWGSWMSASAPYVIAPVEMIVVLFKEVWKKSYKGNSTINREEFMNWTNGLWTFNGESKKRIGHPAPFPLELPSRCIKLFSFEGDVVMDPFLGSGTTLLAAWKNKRLGLGIDIDLDYCRLAKNRLEGIIRDSANESNGTHPQLFQEEPKS